MQHVGPISLLFFWFSILFILKKWDFDVRLTLSDHVAEGKSRYTYMPSVFITITSFVAFTFFWLLPALEAHWSAYVFICLAYFMKIATTIVPRVDGKVMFHDVTAVHTGTFLTLLIASLTISSAVNGGFLRMLQISLVGMLIFGSLALNRGSPHYLLNQGTFFLIFTINIIVLTYRVAG